MATAFLIVLGVILLPVLVIFIRGFIIGWRECQPPPPIPLRQLWYDLVWGQKPKPKQRFRVVFPPPKEEDSSSR